MIVDRDRDGVTTIVLSPPARDQGKLDNDILLDLLVAKVRVSKTRHPAGNRGNGVVQGPTKFVTMQDGASSRGLWQGGPDGQRGRCPPAVDGVHSSLIQPSAGLWAVLRSRKVPRSDDVLRLGLGLCTNVVCLGSIDGRVGVGRLGL